MHRVISIESWVLVTLCVLGFLLRVLSLGDLGFRWDEDLTSIAVKAVNEYGYPLLDSGMVYPRFLPLQYVLSAWTSLFGFSEFTLRFPIAVFGTALIPLTYVISRDLVGSRVALLAAAFMAFDFWQVELARTARMYAPFFFLYGLFIVAVYRGMLWDRRPWRLAVIPLGLLAIWVHDVGLFCAGIVLVPALLVAGERKRLFPYAASAVFLGALVIWQKISSALWALSSQREHTAGAVAEAVQGDKLAGFGALLDSLGSYLYLPYAPFLRAGLTEPFGVISWLAVFGILATIAWRITRNDMTFARATAIAAVLMASLHQFTVVSGLWVLYAALHLQGARGFVEPRTLRITVVLAAGLLFWAIVVPVLGYDVSNLKYVVKSLFEYPRFRLMMAYPIHRPIMSILAIVGAVLVIDRAARREPDKNSLLLIGVLLVSYLGVGVFSTTYSHFRYVLHADVVFLPFAALGTFWLAKQLTARFRSPREVQSDPTIATPTLAATIVIALIAVNPVRAVFAVSRDYVANGPVERRLNLGAYPDYKTTSAYIRANRQAGDQVLVLNPREFYNYLGSVDGWIRSDDYRRQVVDWDGVPHDKYIGVPLIRTLDELETSIARQPGRTWVPFSERVFGFRNFGGVDAEIAEFLRKNADRKVMTGRDGKMVVYLFDDRK